MKRFKELDFVGSAFSNFFIFVFLIVKCNKGFLIKTFNLSLTALIISFCRNDFITMKQTKMEKHPYYCGTEGVLKI